MKSKYLVLFFFFTAVFVIYITKMQSLNINSYNLYRLPDNRYIRYNSFTRDQFIDNNNFRSKIHNKKPYIYNNPYTYIYNNLHSTNKNNFKTKQLRQEVDNIKHRSTVNSTNKYNKSTIFGSATNKYNKNTTFGSAMKRHF